MLIKIMKVYVKANADFKIILRLMEIETRVESECLPQDTEAHIERIYTLHRNPGSWVRASLDPLGFFVGVSLGKTLQSLA